MFVIPPVFSILPLNLNPTEPPLSKGRLLRGCGLINRGGTPVYFHLYLNVVKKDCFASLAMTHNYEKTRCHCEERRDVAISRSSLIVNSFMRCKMSVNLLSIRVCRANNADFMQLVGLQSIRTNPFKI